MPPLENSRHELFAQAVASGKTASEAYRQSGAHGKNADVHAARLTPAGTVSEQSRLCQSYKVTSEVREIRMPDKLRAVEQLAKLCGWNEPERHDVEHGFREAQEELIEVIARMRGVGAPRDNQCAG
jgi:hypothetical protein